MSLASAGEDRKGFGFQHATDSPFGLKIDTTCRGNSWTNPQAASVLKVNEVLPDRGTILHVKDSDSDLRNSCECSTVVNQRKARARRCPGCRGESRADSVIRRGVGFLYSSCRLPRSASPICSAPRKHGVVAARRACVEARWYNGLAGRSFGAAAAEPADLALACVAIFYTALHRVSAAAGKTMARAGCMPRAASAHPEVRDGTEPLGPKIPVRAH
jgi:hypothetical protein